MIYKKKLRQFWNVSFVYSWRPEPELQESGIFSLKSQNWPNLTVEKKVPFFHHLTVKLAHKKKKNPIWCYMMLYDVVQHYIIL